MTQIVDARGLTCPQPVVLTLKAIAQATEVTTIVDNRPAVENVTRLAQAKGCTVAVVEREDGVVVVHGTFNPHLPVRHALGFRLKPLSVESLVNVVDIEAPRVLIQDGKLLILAACCV